MRFKLCLFRELNPPLCGFCVSVVKNTSAFKLDLPQRLCENCGHWQMRTDPWECPAWSRDGT